MSQHLSAIVIGLVLAQAPNSEDKLIKLPKDLAAAQTELVNKLKSDRMWLDPKNEDLLVAYLEAAAVLRPVALAPILAENVNFEPEAEFMPIRSGRAFPAFKALKAIGIQSVNPILHELKNFDAQDPVIKTAEDANKKFKEIDELRHRAWRQQKQTLLIQCLIHIYDQGGFGQTLARQRIELEADNAKGKEKERLLKALQHPAFK